MTEFHLTSFVCPLEQWFSNIMHQDHLMTQLGSFCQYIWLESGNLYLTSSCSPRITLWDPPQSIQYNPRYRANEWLSEWVKSLSRVQLFVTPWTVAHQAPPPWDSPSKSTGVGCHFLLQGIFPTQELNPCLLYWQVDSLPLSHLGSHL